MRFFKLLIVFILLITGCNPSINMNQEKEKLLQTDIEFSNRSAEVGNHQAFLEFASPDVVLLKPESYPIVGKPALKKLYNELSDSYYRLTWKPSYCRISASGDLGYTFGIYLLEITEARLPEGQGEQKGQTSQGTYCSIWEKNAKGEWRFVLDTGNSGLEPTNNNQ
jgi:ketosteroid isomerase-like protein